MQYLTIIWTWVLAHPVLCSTVLWLAPWETIDRLAIFTSRRVPGEVKALFAPSPKSTPLPDPPRGEP